MSNLDVIRAWKDQEYRLGLSEEKLAILPAHPSGLVELANPLIADSPIQGLFTEAQATQCLTCITFCVPTFATCDFCLPDQDAQGWIN